MFKRISWDMIGYVILSIPNKAFINHHVLLVAQPGQRWIHIGQGGLPVVGFRPENHVTWCFAPVSLLQLWPWRFL